MPHKVDTYFHVGDIVHVRRDLRPFERYHMDGDKRSNQLVMPEMARIAGDQVVIEGVVANVEGRYYKIEPTNRYYNGYLWTDEMFDEYIEYIIRESEPQLVAEGDAAILEFISANKI